jgi:tRNA A37 methylthiotransferase MiaB
MASFTVGFLGCKVSHTDAREVRERLLADGHEERTSDAEIAVLNTCCVRRAIAS